MKEKRHTTLKGTITYWTNDISPYLPTLVFLPGLTADHRLFDKQIEYFEKFCNCLVWDAPGHNASRPFFLNFSLEDKAIWLHEILELECIRKPVFVGQSMGGYVSQMYYQLFPNQIAGFVSIDSSPLIKSYVSKFDLWFMKNVEWAYRLYPWDKLLKAGSIGCSNSEYGQKLMREMMESYDKDYYCRLVGHGYMILAEAIEKDLPYKITSPVVLVCGKKDRAGLTKSYNKRWAKKTGYLIHWIDNAGHNSNSDKKDEINRIIEQMLETV